MSKYFYLLIFALGALVFFYPLITSYYNAQTQTRVISNYEEEMQALDKEEKQRLKEEADNYNSFIAELEGNVTDEMTPAEKEASEVVYLSVLATGEAIGYVEIPKIDIKLPIFRGASDAVLDKGIGHLERSSLPVGGVSTHSVLTGHRGLPQAHMFRDLGRLEIGDIFLINTLDERHAYEVESIKIVLPHEVESLGIQEGRDLCTLVTCDPYMINSHRMFVTGHRLDYNPALIEEVQEISFFEKYIEYFVIVGFFALLLVVLWVIRKRMLKKRRRLLGEEYEKS